MVCHYISMQEEHHHKTTFREEYIDFLNHNEIEYKTEYLFEDIGAAPTELNIE